jgi:hypothetical protein
VTIAPLLTRGGIRPNLSGLTCTRNALSGLG